MIRILVPCFNEASVIEKTYAELTEIMQQDSRNNNYKYELLFVDDGRKDNTLTIIQQLAQQDHAVKYISFSRNFGKESAMYAGLKASVDAEALIILDGDLQHPPTLIPQMIQYFKEGEDQIVAKRDRTGENIARKRVSQLYYAMINKMVDVTLEDGVGDFRLLSQRAVKEIVKMGEYNRFSKGLFAWIGFEPKVIEYQNVTRVEGESKWSRIEALSGSEQRVHALATDIINHFETRQKAMKGKGMIVTMSRRIAVDLYDEIVRLKPEWHSDDDNEGVIKVVMTGSSSDPKNFQRHIGPKKRRNLLESRMKDVEDELQLVIVRDMWLTGFDVPSMHTMYIDKPMQGHNLMQAIARVNRVFKDKPGGLIVDYVGIAESLKEALKEYTDSDKDQTGVDTDKALEIMLMKYDVIQDMLYNHDYSDFESDKKSDRYNVISSTMDYVIGLGEEERQRFVNTVTELGKAFALCATEEAAQELNSEIAFLKAVKAGIVKLLAPSTDGGGPYKSPAEVEAEINQLISKSVVTEEVVDIYQTLGLENPDISILSDDFLKDVEGLQQKNVAVELLNKLLKGQVKSLMKTNATVSKQFSEMLGKSIQKYNNRSIEASKVIEELIQMAKEINQEQQRGKNLA